MSLVDQLGLKHPVVQSGMGGEIAGSRLHGSAADPHYKRRGLEAQQTLETHALYAGKSALRIESVLRAAQAVEDLVGVGSEVPPRSPTIRSS